MKLLLVLLPILVCIIPIANAGDQSRLVDAPEASSGRQFPWVVGVHGRNSDGSYNTWTCGGALVSKNLVLTAAHCAGEQWYGFQLTLGSVWAGDTTDSDGKTFRYAKLIIKHGEAMLILMDNPVEYSDTIKTIDLPSSNDYLGDNLNVLVTGWGGTGEHNSQSQSLRLRYMWFNTMTNQNCRNDFNYAVQDSEVCMINAASTACGGDSGSPVAKYEDNKVIHVGIIDKSNCQKNTPALATRTAPHADWINDEIKRHSQ